MKFFPEGMINQNFLSKFILYYLFLGMVTNHISYSISWGKFWFASDRLLLGGHCEFVLMHITDVGGFMSVPIDYTACENVYQERLGNKSYIMIWLDLEWKAIISPGKFLVASFPFLLGGHCEVILMHITDVGGFMFVPIVLICLWECVPGGIGCGKFMI